MFSDSCKRCVNDISSVHILSPMLNNWIQMFTFQTISIFMCSKAYVLFNRYLKPAQASFRKAMKQQPFTHCFGELHQISKTHKWTFEFPKARPEFRTRTSRFQFCNQRFLSRSDESKKLMCYKKPNLGNAWKLWLLGKTENFPFLSGALPTSKAQAHEQELRDSEDHVGFCAKIWEQTVLMNVLRVRMPLGAKIGQT